MMGCGHTNQKLPTSGQAHLRQPALVRGEILAHMLPSLGPNTNCRAERLYSDTRTGTPTITEKVGMNGPGCYEGWLCYIETTARNRGEEGKTFNPTVFGGKTIVTYYGMLCS